jgi:hypothetical protein
MMSHRINVVLDNEVWESLSQLPKGERSRFINEAVANELLKRQRLEAIARIDARRAQMKPVPGSSEEWIREDRESH